MSKMVRHACGHEESHSLFGSFAAEIDRQVAQLTKRICPECQKLARASALEAAADAIGGLDLHELHGSARQIAWANDIRAKRITELIKAKATRPTIEKVAAISNAQWWIDNRRLKRAEFLNSSLSSAPCAISEGGMAGND